MSTSLIASYNNIDDGLHFGAISRTSANVVHLYIAASINQYITALLMYISGDASGKIAFEQLLPVSFPGYWTPQVPEARSVHLEIII